MPQVLIIDDDPIFTRLTADIFEGEEFSVLTADSGKSGIAAARKRIPDLIILDMVLPDLNGLEVCKRLKAGDKTCAIPLIVITGNDKQGLEISCLDKGSDDYLVKPVDYERLLARAQALLRRATTHMGATTTLRLGELKLDFAGKIVSCGGRRIPGLTPKEFGLLYELAMRSPRPASRTELYRSAWGQSAPSRESLKTIDVHVRRVRSKIGWKPDGPLRSVTGRGYRLGPF